MLLTGFNPIRGAARPCKELMTRPGRFPACCQVCKRQLPCLTWWGVWDLGRQERCRGEGVNCVDC